MIKFIIDNGEWQQYQPSCTEDTVLCVLEHANYEAVQDANLSWLYNIYNGVGTEIIGGLRNEWNWFVEMLGCFPCS